MRIKLSRLQRLLVVLSVIYLIIIIFIAWNKWVRPSLPDPRNVISDVPIIDPFLTQKSVSQYKKSLRTERLKIIGIAFMAWIIPSAIVYLLGFPTSKTKSFFKNIRVGIILIFVGIFIPTVFYPLVEPMEEVKNTPERKIKKIKGKEIHYKLNELELVLNAQQFAIPYKYFVVSGIVFVFIGTGICVLNKDKRTTG